MKCFNKLLSNLNANYNYQLHNMLEDICRESFPKTNFKCSLDISTTNNPVVEVDATQYTLYQSFNNTCTFGS